MKFGSLQHIYNTFGGFGLHFLWSLLMKDVFSFMQDTKYCFELVNGTKISGEITQMFDNGIEVRGTWRIPQDKIVYWYEIE